MTYQADGKTVDRNTLVSKLGEEAFRGLIGAARKARAATGKEAVTFWKEGSRVTIRF